VKVKLKALIRGISTFVPGIGRSKKTRTVGTASARYSTHIRILKEQGYRVVCDCKIRSETNITRDDLAPGFESISDDDLTTSGAFIQAVKTP
jgi:hypothetical protein